MVNCQGDPEGTEICQCHQAFGAKDSKDSWWIFLGKYACPTSIQHMGGFQLVMGVPQGRWMVLVNGKIPPRNSDDDDRGTQKILGNPHLPRTDSAHPTSGMS